MVTANGQAKVMDFGLAKLRGGISLTRSQTTLGTVAYMSPEQARGDELDERTDIWSLGVVLYEMLAGKLPFRGDHDQAVIHSILHQEPESLLKARPGTAPELEQVVGQALAKKAADRYQTMEEFREDLAAVAEGLKAPQGEAPAVRTEDPRARYRLFPPRRPGGRVRARSVSMSEASGIGFSEEAASVARAVKLAVLPSSILSGDPEQEYPFRRPHPGDDHPARTPPPGEPQRHRPLLGHALQEGRYADRPDRPELGVDYVLEGSMRREKNRVRITAELIQVRDQTQLWADSYERELSGILAVQSEVAQNVAKALALKLLPAEQARLASTRTVNPEAYDAYLKGSYHLQKLTAVDLDTAQRYLELALEKDPSFAPAYAGLSWVWGGRAQMGLASPLETGPKAKAAALQAVSSDDSSAEAHEALVWIKTWTDWDWAGAEPEWRRTLELNPNSAQTHALYSHFLANVGRIDEAASAY